MLFDGTETSRQPFLLKDSRGRSLSRLVIRDMDHAHAGVYVCNPASASPVNVTVHVINGTVLAVADNGEHVVVVAVVVAVVVVVVVDGEKE